MSQDSSKPPFSPLHPLPTGTPRQPVAGSEVPQEKEAESSARQSLFVPESESDEWLLKEFFSEEEKPTQETTEPPKHSLEIGQETRPLTPLKPPVRPNTPPPLKSKGVGKSKLVLKSRSQMETPEVSSQQASPPPLKPTGVGKSKLVLKSRSQQEQPNQTKGRLVLKSRNQQAQPGGQRPVSKPQTRPLPGNDVSLKKQYDKPETPRLVNNDPLVGEIINNRFRLLELIGQGGMGKVYKAQQVGLTRLLVIKLLHPQFAEDPVRKARFHREAEAMTRFTHPNAVTVFDFGEWKNQMYMAMELLKGGSLADLMNEGRLLPTTQVVSILEQACQALEAAHKVGLIHRDLKPENIMLNDQIDGQYEVKLVDFGLAYFMEMEGQERLTAAGIALGTPCYMSPEQARGKSLDARTDIYALGIMLYEMLCGSLPFLSKNVTQLMMQHIFEQPEKPSVRNPKAEINPALEELALAAISKRSENRPQSSQSFRELLLMAEENPTGAERVRSSLGVLARSERATKLGIQVSSQISVDTELPPHAVAVVEEPKEAMDSTAVGLVTQGFFAEPTRSIDDGFNWLQETSPSSCRVLVVSLGSEPDTMFDEVVRFGKANPDFPLAVVGPSKDATLMTRALEEDVDYLPESLVEKKLPKHLRRLFKKHFRKKKRK